MRVVEHDVCVSFGGWKPLSVLCAAADERPRQLRCAHYKHIAPQALFWQRRDFYSFISRLAVRSNDPLHWTFCHDVLILEMLRAPAVRPSHRNRPPAEMARTSARVQTLSIGGRNVTVFRPVLCSGVVA